MAKWATKLKKFEISYHSRSSMKVQVLTNFLVEYSWLDDKLKEVPTEQLAEQFNPGIT